MKYISDVISEHLVKMSLALHATISKQNDFNSNAGIYKTYLIVVTIKFVSGDVDGFIISLLSDNS